MIGMNRSSLGDGFMEVVSLFVVFLFSQILMFLLVFPLRRSCWMFLRGFSRT